MKILIIGGTRFIGKVVASQLSDRGHEVVLFNRGKHESNLPYKTIIGDVDCLQDFKSNLRELNPDVVVHAIAYTEKHVTEVIEVFLGTKTRMVVLKICIRLTCTCVKARQLLTSPIPREIQDTRLEDRVRSPH